MATTIPGLAIKVDGDASGLEKTLAGVKGSIDKLVGSASLTALSTGITASLMVVDRVFHGISTAINLAERGLSKFLATADRLGKLKDLGEQLNLGVGELVGLNRGARMTGTSGEVLQSAILKMRGNIGDAMSGGNDPFGAIGLSLERLSGLSSSGQLGAVFDALNKIADPSRRQAAGQDIFGKMFKSIELLSREGSGGIKRLTTEMEALGLSISKGMLDRIDKADDALADVSEQFTAITDKVAGAFAPALERSAKAVSKIIADLQGSGKIDGFINRLEAFADVMQASFVDAASAPAGDMSFMGVKLPKSASESDKAWGKWLLGPIDDIFTGVNSAVEAKQKEIENRNKREAEKEKWSGAVSNPMSNGINRAIGGVNGIAGMIGKGIMQGVQGLNWIEKQALSMKGPQGTTIGQPQFAGALEAGSAAAYAAAYQRDQKSKTDEKIADNTKAAAKNAADTTNWVKKVWEKLPNLRLATI